MRRYPRFQSLHRCGDWTPFTFSPVIPSCMLSRICCARRIGQKARSFLVVVVVVELSSYTKKKRLIGNRTFDKILCVYHIQGKSRQWFWDRLFPASKRCRRLVPHFSILEVLDRLPRHQTSNTRGKEPIDETASDNLGTMQESKKEVMTMRKTRPVSFFCGTDPFSVPHLFSKTKRRASSPSKAIIPRSTDDERDEDSGVVNTTHHQVWFLL